MITLKNIKKVFETEDIQTWALQNVDLEVKEGEFVAIMGPSGCGKSTLLNILGLLDTPTQGTYLLNGVDVSTMNEDQRTDIRKGKLGFVFQSFNLIGTQRFGKRGTPPHLYGCGQEGASSEGEGSYRACCHVASCPTLPLTALGRSATARSHCACRNCASEHHPCRRTYG